MQSALFCLGHKSVTGHNAKVNGPEPIWCYLVVYEMRVLGQGCTQITVPSSHRPMASNIH